MQRLLALFLLLTWMAPPVAAAAPLKVLVLGDSLTEGYGVPKEAAFPALIEKELKAKGYKNLVVVNAGISGSTSASGVSRLKWQLKAAVKPRVLVLALGANDGLRGLDVQALKQNLTAVVHLAKQNGISKILIAGMLVPPNYGKDYATRFARVFPDVAKAESVALMPFLLDGVAADRTLNQADGIHPTAAGHKIIAHHVVKYLIPLLGPP